MIRARCRWAGGRCSRGLAYALTSEELPDSAQVFTPAGPGPADVVANAVRLAVSGGTVHLGRLLAPAGVRYVVVVDALAPSLVGTTPTSVSAPPPPGLDTDLLEQDDLQVVPGVLGVQVYENGEDMPVTAARVAGLPSRAAPYPSAADVAGWQPVLSALSDGAPATGPVSPGTLYAGYAPAGSFALDARRSHRGAAAGVRLGGAVHGRRQGHGLALPLAVPPRPVGGPARAGGLGAGGRAP